MRNVKLRFTQRVVAQQLGRSCQNASAENRTILGFDRISLNFHDIQSDRKNSRKDRKGNERGLGVHVLGSNSFRNISLPAVGSCPRGSAPRKQTHKFLYLRAHYNFICAPFDLFRKFSNFAIVLTDRRRLHCAPRHTYIYRREQLKETQVSRTICHRVAGVFRGHGLARSFFSPFLLVYPSSPWPWLDFN